jgi:cytochrome c553
MKQLASFQNNMRNVAVMHGVAQALKVDEMRSVAVFLETLH